MSRSLSESDIIKTFAGKIYERLTRKAITDLQRMTDSLLSGDDPGLNNIWEEICVQVQSEQSVSWDAYDETVRALVAKYVSDLQPHEREALWLQTSEGMDWSYEDAQDRDAYPISQEDIIEFLKDQHLYAKAADWTNSRIRAAIERQDD